MGKLHKNSTSGIETHQLTLTSTTFPRIPRATVWCSSAVVSNMEERERKGVKPHREEPAAAACFSAPSAPEPGGTAGDDDADKTDVCSERFDPLLALYSPTVLLPFPNVKCFNNVSDYESFLKGGRGRAKPENVEKRRRKAMKGVADPERIERLKKLMVNNPVAESEEGESSGAQRPRRRPKPQKNVLTRMPCRFQCPHSLVSLVSLSCLVSFGIFRITLETWCHSEPATAAQLTNPS